MSNYKTKISSSREAFEQNNGKHDLEKKKHQKKNRIQIHSVMLRLTRSFNCSRVSRLQLRFTNMCY